MARPFPSIKVAVMGSALPVPADFRQFKAKGKSYCHIENGWCVRQLDRTDKSGTVWRIFYGVLRPGTEYPPYLNAYVEADAHVDFDDFPDAVAWVRGRRG